MRIVSIATLAAAGLAFAAPASAQVWVNGQMVQPGASGNVVWSPGPASNTPLPGAPMVSPNPPYVAGGFVGGGWNGGYAGASSSAYSTSAMRWGGNINGRWYGGVHAPGGWRAYRRPTMGWSLPRYWRAPNFYINDYWSYGLGAPPGGYSWVRYYDDAVLVDGRGRIFDARYGIDWDGSGYDDGYGYGDGYGRRVREPYPYFSRDEAVSGGALAGAGAGALAGAAIAGPPGALIGAGLGIFLGGGLGNAEYDAHRAERGMVTYEEPLPPPPAPTYSYGPAAVPGCGAVYPAPPPGYGAGCTTYPVGGYAPPVAYAPPAAHVAYSGGGCVNWCGSGYAYGGGSSTTVVVSSAPVVTTTVVEEIVEEEVVTYEPVVVRQTVRRAPRRVHRPKPRPRKSCSCVCTTVCR